MVNVLCAVFLGPGWGVLVAFCASLIRNLLSVGSLMAFPGSMIGALCCGLVYMALRKRNNDVVAIVTTLAAEMFGTGVLGGLCAYPVRHALHERRRRHHRRHRVHHPLPHLHRRRQPHCRSARIRAQGGRSPRTACKGA